jgi:hypothetical protein
MSTTWLSNWREGYGKTRKALLHKIVMVFTYVGRMFGLEIVFLNEAVIIKKG